MRRPYLIALTGGIGSGKTTVLNMFKEKGIPCYIADEEAKQLMVEDKDLINAIKNEFGDNAYTSGLKLDTKYLSSQVFQDEKRLEKLNSIVHPAVKNHFNKWVSQQRSKFVIYESALIFENNQQHQFDEVILVTAPEEDRINRVKKRSGLAKNDIKNRMKRQLDDNIKINKASYIIENVKIKETKLKVNNIYKKILNNYY